MDIHHVRIAVSIAVMFILALEDIKRKEINACILYVYLSIGIVGALFNESILELVLSAVPGILFILLGKVSYEQIGYGDGFAVLALGIWLGTIPILKIIAISTFCCGVIALLLLIFRRKQKTIAFIPFLFLGMVMNLGQ